MNENMGLLLFSIGPVQSFIAEARRTHDLWAGSRILVDVTRAAIEAIDKKGANLVFPAHVHADCIPNVFAMIVPWDEAVSLAQQAQDASKKKFIDIAEDAKNRLLNWSSISIDNDFSKIWKVQLERHLEFYWVACQKRSDENYGQWYKRSRLALEARKRTRDFQHAEEEGMKDSLSGQRSALRTKTQNAQKFWQDIQTKLKNKSILQSFGREKLDAIGVTKRFSKWGRVESFPSTSSIAAAPFLKEAAKKAPTLLKRFEQALDDLKQAGVIFELPHFNDAISNLPDWHYDGFYFFKERLSTAVIQRELGRSLNKKENELLEKARTQLVALYQKLGHPPTYYVIILLDGDNMGDHISKCNDINQHKDLSQRLENFAKSVGKLLGDGSCAIYAGGDDLLAMVPLENALQSAQRLREKYSEIFSDWPKKYPGTRGNNKDFTCSVGIAIVHHEWPLDAALQEARAAEQRAKNIYQRDAISITVVKRSGEPVEVGAKWSFGSSNTLEHFINQPKGIISLFNEKKIAMKFPYDFAQEAGALIVLPKEACESSLRRLLKRHAPKLSDSDKESLAKQLAELASKMEDSMKNVTRSLSEDEQEQHKGPIELGNWLLLARFIAQGGRE